MDDLLPGWAWALIEDYVDRRLESRGNTSRRLPWGASSDRREPDLIAARTRSEGLRSGGRLGGDDSEEG